MAYECVQCVRVQSYNTCRKIFFLQRKKERKKSVWFEVIQEEMRSSFDIYYGIFVAFLFSFFDFSSKRCTIFPVKYYRRVENFSAKLKNNIAEFEECTYLLRENVICIVIGENDTNINLKVKLVLFSRNSRQPQGHQLNRKTSQQSKYFLKFIFLRSFFLFR